MKWLSTLLLVSLVMLLAACQSADVFEEPPEILYGQDICAECSMIINDPRFAAAYVTTEGQIRLFDDIGDMLAHDTRIQEEVQVYWVHDFNSEKWTRATEATFVLNNELLSPMSWGVAAFKTAADATSYRTMQGGLAVTFAELRHSVADGTLDPASLHNHTSHMNIDHRDTEMTHDEVHEMDHEMAHDGN